MSFNALVSLSLCCLLWVSCNSGRRSTLDLTDGTYRGDLNRVGQKHGFGIYRWPDGSVFKGNFKNDLRHGNGRFLWSNGESYEGEYQEDHRAGKGSYTWPDGDHYDGDFLFSKRHGFGVFRSSSGSIYEGEWLNDQQHGKGKLTRKDGAIFEGIWRKGVLLKNSAILPPLLNKDQESDQATNEVSTARPASTRKLKSKVALEAQSSPIFSTDQPPSKSLEANPHKSSQENVSLPDLEGSDLSTTEEKEITITNNTLTKSSHADTESETKLPTWVGTVSEAEIFFITDLVDGIDTVHYRSTGIPFSGCMRIVNERGQAQGEVNLDNGRLHGEEIFFDANGEIMERNFWADGRPIGQ